MAFKLESATMSDDMILDVSNALQRIKNRYDNTSYAEIARLLGMSRQYLSLLLNGNREPSHISYRLIMALDKNPNMITFLREVTP